ncbi:MAG TPA: hypothetical protein VNT79_02540 [Phycisphaerae bacterium]|nr:hypothetical protein [Phycisphaerae bacterium]
MRPAIYIETTIPSYYYDDRESIASDVRRTREWWDSERDLYECFISASVLEEISAGDYPHKAECVQLVEHIPILEINARVVEIAESLSGTRTDGETAHP